MILFTLFFSEVTVAEFHRKIKEAFEVFDHESNDTVDVREIGTIIRSLGCCPSEGELHDLIAEVEEEEPTGYIRFEKFLPVMTKVLLERRYRPIPEDVLLRAFEVLDTAKRGYLTREELVKLMTEEEGAVQSGRCLRLEAGTPQASGTGLHASGSPQDAKMVCILV
uniref:EF-hand domain-containing protein n=1 Tax=Castor canadensis TaxID=51338 RepID=A0A8C0WIJ4_CASCN